MDYGSGHKLLQQKTPPGSSSELASHKGQGREKRSDVTLPRDRTPFCCGVYYVLGDTVFSSLLEAALEHSIQGGLRSQHLLCTTWLLMDCGLTSPSPRRASGKEREKRVSVVSASQLRATDGSFSIFSLICTHIDTAGFVFRFLTYMQKCYWCNRNKIQQSLTAGTRKMCSCNGRDRGRVTVLRAVGD